MNNSRGTFRTLVMLSAVIFMTACNSSPDDPDDPPENRAPAANAGANLTGMTGDAISLIGSATDADGDSLTYEWTITSGPANGGTLTNATSASASFSATAAGAYALQLTAKDPSNATGSASITVTISTPPSAAAKVTVDKPYLFLTAIGQSAALNAQPLDANGAPITEPVTWTSSSPNQVNVDSSGHIVATAIGSAQIVAHVGSVASQPVLIVVAEPKAGALLVTDAQIESVGAAIGLAPDVAPGVGTRYEVKLRGVDAPAPGTVVLAAETTPVAGKVVSTRTEDGAVIATLEIAPLYDLLARYHIDWNIDLSAFPLEFPSLPAGSAQKAHRVAYANPRPQAGTPEPLQIITCDGSVEGKLADLTLDISQTSNLALVLQDYRDDPTLPPNYSKHALEGSVNFEGTATVDFKPQINFSGTCKAEGKFKLPVLGWVSLIVMPQIALGVGLEMNADLIVTTARLGGTLNLDLKPVVGWKCGGVELTCESVDNLSLETKFKPIQEFDIRNGMHAELSGHLFAYARLDALVLGGLGGAVAIVEGRIGPKQSLDLAFEDTQAKNSVMASNYDLKIDASVKPGDGLKKAIAKLINDDAVNVSFSIKQPIPISESPKGTLHVSKSRVALGDKMTFSVDINPETKDYLGLGANFGKGYNIDSIELWRKREDEEDFEFWRNVPPIASGDATAFLYEWTPEPADAGKTQFAAFVNTKYPALSHLEVEADSMKEIEVSCFTAGASAARAKAMRANSISPLADVCADEWNGHSEHNLPHIETMQAEVHWIRAPAEENDPPTLVRYLAQGTFEHHNLAIEEQGCTISPTTFVIGPPSANDANSLFIDYSTTPAQYGGIGAHADMVTITCPDEDPATVPVSLSWFNGAGSLSEDGLTIGYSVSTPVGSTSYQFVRP